MLIFLSFSLPMSLFAVVEMAMNSILNTDDIKKALDAFQGDFFSCHPEFHAFISSSHIYFYSKIWLKKTENK